MPCRDTESGNFTTSTYLNLSNASLMTVKQVCIARKMLTDPEMTIKEVAEAFGVNRATIYRSLGLGSYAKGSHGRCMMKTPVMDEVDPQDRVARSYR
jgi:hypothetical protein